MSFKPGNEYNALLPLWKKCRAVVGGDDALKSSDVLRTVVPPLSGQEKDEYTAMVSRATLFNATGRTVDGLIGMVMRKPAVTKVPADLKPILQDMTLALDSQVDLNELAVELLHDDVTIGRVGLLVDMPVDDGAEKTLAQVKAKNLRPYVTIYPAESIIDYRFDRVNNAAQLVMVRLIENVVEWISDIDSKTIEQERRLLLREGGYLQQIYRKGEDGNLVQVGGDIVPKMKGKPLNFIPFVCDFDTKKPPVLDLVNVNLSHFMTDVDRENGAHYTAIPTPMFAGFTFEKNEPFRLGYSGGYASNDPQAQWGYLEFEGTGLTTLKEIKEEKQEQMAVLGARFLTSEKAAAEATETVKIRRSGETSVIAKIAQKRAQALQRVLEIMRDWLGSSGDISVELNTDFAEAGLSAQDLTALVGAWQSGAFSQQTLFWNLQHGEIIPEDVDFETEQERINSQNPDAIPLNEKPQQPVS